MTDLTPYQQVMLDLSNAGVAMGGTVAVLFAVVLGMAFVRAVWS